MPLSTSVQQLERDKFVEADGVADQPAVVVTNADGSAVSNGVKTSKARLTAAATFLEVTGTDLSQFHEARVTNGATAQYIQIWDAHDAADIASNGVLMESVYATAQLSFSLAPKDATEEYARGIVLAASSTEFTYTAGVNLGMTTVEYVTP